MSDTDILSSPPPRPSLPPRSDSPPPPLMRQIKETWWYMGVEGLRGSKNGDEHYIIEQYGWGFYAYNDNGKMGRKVTYNGKTYLGFSPDEWVIPDHNPVNDVVFNSDSEDEEAATGTENNTEA